MRRKAFYQPRILPIVIIMIVCSISTLAKNKLNIKTVDFKNYTYWLQDQEAIHYKGNIKVKNGLYEKNYLYFRIDSVVYGDLTGDRQDEAVVVAEYGGILANFFQTNTYIFTMHNDRVKLLDIIAERRTSEECWKRLKEPLYEAIANGREIKRQTLIVRHFGGGGHVDHVYVISALYKWSGNRFTLRKMLKRSSTEKDKILSL